MKKLIILDRDGVINEDSDVYIKTPDEWHAIPSSLTAIARLNQTQHTVVVATNQSGVGRGYYNLDTLNAIHAKMTQQLAVAHAHVDAIFYCPHTPEDNCSCRKPKPGLMQQIITQYPDFDIAHTYVVGDSWRDLAAGLAMGFQVALVRTGKGEFTLQQYADKLLDIPIYENLAAFVEDLLENFLPRGN